MRSLARKTLDGLPEKIFSLPVKWDPVHTRNSQRLHFGLFHHEGCGLALRVLWMQRRVGFVV